jgi:hypothetical protein
MCKLSAKSCTKSCQCKCTFNFNKHFFPCLIFKFAPTQVVCTLARKCGTTEELTDSDQHPSLLCLDIITGVKCFMIQAAGYEYSGSICPRTISDKYSYIKAYPTRKLIQALALNKRLFVECW